MSASQGQRIVREMSGNFKKCLENGHPELSSSSRRLLSSNQRRQSRQESPANAKVSERQAPPGES